MRSVITPAGLRGVTELRYLNAENVARYRAIMRFFYTEYQRLRYWLKPEHVYESVQAWGVVEGFTMEQCMSDLEQLKEWGNLASRHDGGRALSVEEYMRKKSQYLLTPYSIEIERMLETLETIRGYGGSLETTYLDVIAECLLEVRAKTSGEFASGEALACWERLYQSFKQMHENAADFIASMHSIQADDMMATEAFLAMKDKLTDYLQHFVMGLQRSAYRIEGHLNVIPTTVRDLFLEQVAADELAKPRLDVALSQEELVSNWQQGWDNLRRWFLGDGRDYSELQQLERATKETIARVVRCALRLQERKRVGVSRRRDLEHLAAWFDRMEGIKEAHCLAAYTFGLFASRHLQGEDVRSTDRTDAMMWQEPPAVRGIRQRGRRRGGRADTEPVRLEQHRRQEFKEQIEQQLREERAFLERLAQQGQVRIGELEVLASMDRLRLLQWIGRCTSRSDRSFVTADGIRITLSAAPLGNAVLLHCVDGELEMPDYTLYFAYTLGTEVASHG